LRGQMSLGGQDDVSIARPRNDLIVCSAVKDLQLADRAERIPAQVARIQRMTIENNYFHESHDFAHFDNGGLSFDFELGFSTAGIPFALGMPEMGSRRFNGRSGLVSG